jgi:hypothetical protein
MGLGDQESFSRRDDLTEEQMDERDELVNAAVADALEALAIHVRSGLPLEMADWYRNEDLKRYHTIYGRLTTFSEVFRAAFDEHKRMLIQHRDFGSVADRVRNEKGLVPQPAADLPIHVRGSASSYDSWIDQRPGY